MDLEILVRLLANVWQVSIRFFCRTHGVTPFAEYHLLCMLLWEGCWDCSLIPSLWGVDDRQPYYLGSCRVLHAASIGSVMHGLVILYLQYF